MFCLFFKFHLLVPQISSPLNVNPVQSSADLLSAQKNRAKPKQKKAINKPNEEEDSTTNVLSPYRGNLNLDSEDQRMKMKNITSPNPSEPVVESKVSEDNNTMMNSQVAYQQVVTSSSAGDAHAHAPVPVPVSSPNVVSEEEINASYHSNAAGLVQIHTKH